MSTLAPTTDHAAFEAGQRTQQRTRKIKAQGFRVLLFTAVAFAVGALGALLWTTFEQGRGFLNWHLITNMPSRKP